MNSRRLQPVLDELDFRLLEARDLRSGGIRIEVVLRRGVRRTEIEMILLRHASGSVQIPSAKTHSAIIDFLGRHPHRFYDAAQIAAALRRDPLYERSRADERPRSLLTHRTSIKVYIARARRALGTALVAAGIGVDPISVLVSRRLSSNAVGYSLAAHVERRELDA